MSATKVLHQKALLPVILAYASKNCSDLSNGYRNCRPPFQYKNTATGETRDCQKACYQHMAEWLAPLLQNIPTKLISDTGNVITVSPPSKYTSDGKYYFVVHHKADVRGRISVRIEVLDNDIEFEYQKDEKRRHGNTYFPESIPAMAKLVEKLFNESKRGGSLDIRFPEFSETLPLADDLEEYKFPADNEGWSRFREYVERVGPHGLALRLTLNP